MSFNDPFRGYDQWKTASPYDDDGYEDFVDDCCSNCICQKWCPLSFEATEHNCLVIRGIIDKQTREAFEADCAMEAQMGEMEDYGDYPEGDDPEEMDASFFNDTCGR